MTTQTASRRSYWPHAIIGFFGVIIVLNFVLLFLAVQGYGGLLDTHPYEKGLVYDEELEKLRNFRDAGWTLTLESQPMHVTLRYRAGAPVNGAHVRLTALRPDDTSADLREELQAESDGGYRGRLSLRAGLWLLGIEIEHDGKKFSFKEQRVL
jgi:nitrogen fixation protein FixH